MPGPERRVARQSRDCTARLTPGADPFKRFTRSTSCARGNHENQRDSKLIENQGYYASEQYTAARTIGNLGW